MEGVEAIGGGQEGQGPVDGGRMDWVTEQRNRSARRAINSISWHKQWSSSLLKTTMRGKLQNNLLDRHDESKKLCINKTECQKSGSKVTDTKLSENLEQTRA